MGRDGQGATMFTGALAEVLKTRSVAATGRQMTLGELCSETGHLIRSRHGLDGVIPQCHSPGQTDGDVARIPMFLAGAPAVSSGPEEITNLPASPPMLTSMVVEPKAAPAASNTGVAFQDHALVGDMVVIPAGSFQMGSDPWKLREYCEKREIEMDWDESPARTVIVPRPLAVATTTVTVAQFRRFARATGFVVEPGAYGYTRDGRQWRYNSRSWDEAGFPQDGTHPVTCVSWQDCQEYLEWLRGETGNASYRLLTEAEWEYCCRAASSSWYSCGDKINTSMANFDDGEGREGTVPAKKFSPNAWGLYQLHGNVQEWCDDPWHDDYSRAPSDSRRWPGGDTAMRVVRGGSWWDVENSCRSAYRASAEIDHRNIMIGFRIARDV